MTARFIPTAAAPATPAGGILPGRLTVTGLLLIGGWLHGVAARLAWSWRDSADNDLAQALGVSPLELMIAGIAAIGLYRGASAERLGLPALGFVLLLLVPSSLAAHGSLVLFALWVAAGTAGETRSSALLFAGLGACGLWSVLYGQIAGDWPLRADAILTQGLLQAVLPGVERVGNVLGMPGGHRIIILAGCSTAYGLPLVLLGLAALSLRDGRLPPRFGRAALALAAVYTAANLLRLTFLGISDDFYRIGHGPYGEMLFDALVIALPLAIAGRTVPDLGAARPAGPRPRHQSGADRRTTGATAGGAGPGRGRGVPRGPGLAPGRTPGPDSERCRQHSVFLPSRLPRGAGGRGGRAGAGDGIDAASGPGRGHALAGGRRAGPGAAAGPPDSQGHPGRRDRPAGRPAGSGDADPGDCAGAGGKRSLRDARCGGVEDAGGATVTLAQAPAGCTRPALCAAIHFCSSAT